MTVQRLMQSTIYKILGLQKEQQGYRNLYNKVSKYIGVSTSNQTLLTRTNRQCTNNTQLQRSTDPRQMGPRSLRTDSHWANVNEAQLVPRAPQWCERSAACALEKAPRHSTHLHTCEARTEQNTKVVAHNCTTKCKAQQQRNINL